MPLARILAAGLLFCSLFAFTRKQQPTDFGLPIARNWEYRTENADHYALVFPNRTISHGAVSRLSEDKTCYTIRSYVVARATGEIRTPRTR